MSLANAYRAEVQTLRRSKDPGISSKLEVQRYAFVTPLRRTPGMLAMSVCVITNSFESQTIQA
jgi:hypothetical protein